MTVCNGCYLPMPLRNENAIMDDGRTFHPWCGPDAPYESREAYFDTKSGGSE